MARAARTFARPADRLRRATTAANGRISRFTVKPMVLELVASLGANGVLAVFVFLLALTGLVRLAIGYRRIPHLKGVAPPVGDEGLPVVSVIVAARNEASQIRQGLGSLLAQDYPRLEFHAIDDRSTDRTGEILRAMAQRDPRLTVHHLTELPDRWLGKNYALFRGAACARGQLLLFTDADVVMEPTTIRRAVGYLLSHGIDHLTLTPDVRMPTRLFEAMVVTFTIFFCAFVRPWKVKDARSNAHVGIGAFNLIRAGVYRQTGTHEAIRMRPDDDLKLGKLVKIHGFRQEIAAGRELLSVPWYASVREMIEGLMKNSFSAVDYRVSVTVLATSLLLLVYVWPFPALFLSGGSARLIYLLTVLVLLWHYVDAAHTFRSRPWLAPLFPLGVLLLVYIQWRAMLLIYIRGGIRWRGTHYAMADLKENRV